MDGVDENGTLSEEENMEKMNKDVSYKIPCNMGDLESLIDSALGDLNFGGKVESSFSELHKTLDEEQKKVQEINKIFQDCENELQKLQNDLASTGNGTEVESDDDVQLVDVTYEPKAVKPTPQQLLMQALQKKGSIQPGQYYLQPNGELKPLAPGQVAPPGSQVVSVKSNIQQHQQTPIRPKQPQMIAPAPTMSPQIEQLAQGMKLYGKKHNEIWYKGTLLDMLNMDGPANQRRYKIRFDGKGSKVLNGKNIAFANPPTHTLHVGTRIIAMYIDDEIAQRSSFYAGVVAESPSVRNNHRYLVFFDDGYAQYSNFKDIRKVYEQSKNVWDDIDPSSSSFIKNYIVQYPERPMVRLQTGQVIKTEWNGRWWIARVIQVDASLVKMYFDADKRVEWIYRGSTRLEPLYTELANAEANKLRGRRHQLTQKSARKPIVEYTRQSQNEELTGGRIQQRTIQPIGLNKPDKKASAPDTSSNGKKKAVAKKSTGKVDGQTNSARGFVASSVSSNRTGLDMASILQNKLGQADTEELDEDALGERVGVERTVSELMRKCFKPHVCGPACLSDIDDDPIKMKGNNPLLIPMLYGWERQIAKQKPSYKKFVFYRAPCARRLRSLKEVDEYLVATDSQLTIDLFCFDPFLHTDTEFVPIKTFCDIKDLSYGKENVPISCVNGIDRQYPDYVDYSIVRTPGKGVDFNLNDDFMCGCDCTDNCQDKKNCACQQLTITASAATALNVADPDTGYEYRKLPGYIVTGIYECNSKCGCDRRCRNRVAQNGLQLRLQVFKTEKRGWGMRCLDDIPAGGFICVYAGQMLSEQGANEDGQKYGDEYLAELDFIEVVERGKEGYESDVEDIEAEGQENDDEDDDDMDEEMEEGAEDADSGDDLIPSDSDSTYSGEKRFLSRVKSMGRSSSKTVDKVVLRRQSSDSNEDIWSVKAPDLTPQNKVQEWVQTLPAAKPVPTTHAASDAILIISSDEDSNPGGFPQVDGTYDDDDSNKKTTEEETSRTTLSSTSTSTTNSGAANNAGKDEVVSVSSSKETTAADAIEPMTVDTSEGAQESSKADDAITVKSEKSGINTPDSEKDNPLQENDDEEMAQDNSGTDEKVDEEFGALQITEPTSLNVENAKEEEDDEDDESEANIFQRTTRSQTQANHDIPPPAGGEEKTEEKPQHPSLRDLFNDQDCYVMDAKSMGNLGRYLNHSCQPNVFVQNVFIDTHDLRFPWVAFFAAQYIRAGTELTWDYNYEIGSVPGKVLYCYCGAAECRGRLL